MVKEKELRPEPKFAFTSWLHFQTLLIRMTVKANRAQKLYYIKVLLFSHVPWTVAHQYPLSMGFSRQEYWSGLPFPSST